MTPTIYCITPVNAFTEIYREARQSRVRSSDSVHTLHTLHRYRHMAIRASKVASEYFINLDYNSRSNNNLVSQHTSFRNVDFCCHLLQDFCLAIPSQRASASYQSLVPLLSPKDGFTLLSKGSGAFLGIFAGMYLLPYEILQG